MGWVRTRGILAAKGNSPRKHICPFCSSINSSAASGKICSGCGRSWREKGGSYYYRPPLKYSPRPLLR